MRNILRQVHSVLRAVTPQKIRVRLSPHTQKLQRSLKINNPIKPAVWPSHKPFVSIVIPSLTFNQTVLDAIDSVLSQTFQNIEIILVDSSIDPVLKNAFNNFQHLKVKKLTHYQTRDLAAIVNFGISKADGKYIACLEPSFQFFPTYLEKTIFRLESAGLDLVSSAVALPAAPRAHDSQHIAHAENQQWIPADFFDLHILAHKNGMAPTSIFSRKLWKKMGGLPGDTKHSLANINWGKFLFDSIAHGARARGISDVLVTRIPSILKIVEGVSLLYTWNFTFAIPRERQRPVSRHAIRLANNATEIYRSAQNSIAKYSREMGKSLQTSGNRRTVLLVLPYLVLGGAERRFQEIGRWLKEAGYRILVLTSEYAGPGAADVSYRFEPFCEGIFQLPKFLDTASHASYQWHDFVHYLITTRHIDLILLGGSRFMYEMLPEITEQHPNVVIVDQQFNTSGHFQSNRSFKRHIHHTIAENESIESALLNLHAESSERVSLIHNGIDVEGDFNPANHRQHERPTVLENKLVISCIGRLSEEKGPDIFLEIARRFARRRDVHFILAGPGPLAEDLTEKRKLFGLEKRVLMPGTVDSATYLSFTDILVVPSRLDGRPNAVLEALAMGVAIVASRVGGLPHLLRDEQTALLCNSEDVLGFCAAIELLLENPDLRLKLGIEGRRYAQEELNVSRCRSAYLELFSKLLNPTKQQHNIAA